MSTQLSFSATICALAMALFAVTADRALPSGFDRSPAFAAGPFAAPPF